jgi:hypothetical protein
MIFSRWGVEDHHARRQSRKHILPLIKDVHIGVTAQSAGGFDTGSLAR